MGDLRWRSAIVLVVFSWFGLVIDELFRVDLVRLGEEIFLLSKLLDIDCVDLIYMLELVDVSLKFRCAGRAHGRVFEQLDII